MKKDELVHCEYCGTPDLVWARRRAGWRLLTEKGDIHVCSEYYQYGHQVNSIVKELNESDIVKLLKKLEIAIYEQRGNMSQDAFVMLNSIVCINGSQQSGQKV